MKFFAGIGARTMPASLKPLVKAITEKLNDRGYTLRSGGADGADSYFEEYATSKEIYLPWKGFNGNPSQLYNTPHEAYTMAERFHPAWHKLRDTVKALMARNSCQIFGLDMKTPVEFVICWTEDGTAIGGTSQALRVAEAHNIPVFNLRFDPGIQSLISYLKSN